MFAAHLNIHPTSFQFRLLLPPTSPPHRPPSSSTKNQKRTRSRRVGVSMDHAASSSSSSSLPSSSVMDFPHLPPAHRELMIDLLSTVEARLGPQLLPSGVPADVLSFQSPNGASQGALDIRAGGPGSSIDFILESWLHCKVPTGALNITTLFAFLNASTDAPHLLMEFIQSSSTSLILFIDLLPRKDLVLHPDYLEEYYQQTNLDKQRQELEKVPQVLPYLSSSLYIRSVLSPTAIAIIVNCGAEGQSRMEEIMETQLVTASKEIVRVWLETCASSIKQLKEIERADLLKRDSLIKTKTVEIDLAANLPRLFGPDVADRVVGEIQKTFRI